ncbi:11337_t:CDS:2 [Ambispora gerdemannii]|uniref:11337_t:CDS:1 n=1 Tax=Ambispora gerdemannii TaxID=144530 RepID=A0A9N9FCG4_9GLOM|nr:11337_t:CDS:2 [Ambispora gerdemannii]
MGTFPSKTKRSNGGGVKNDLFDQQGQSYIDKSQDLQHFVRAVWKANFLSPVRETLSAGDAKVLDVWSVPIRKKIIVFFTKKCIDISSILKQSCGVGTWMFDNASDFNKAKFLGIDIKQILPSEKPLNVRFQIADVLQRLPFDDNCFDFVYVQFVTLWFTEQQLIENILPECVRVLKPGGWIEISDSDVHLYMKVAQQLKKRNFNPFVGNRLEFFLQTTGKVQKIQKKELELSLSNLNMYGAGMGDMAFKMYSQLGIRSGIELGENSPSSPPFVELYQDLYQDSSSKILATCNTEENIFAYEDELITNELITDACPEAFFFINNNTVQVLNQI